MQKFTSDLDVCVCVEFDEAADLLSADPEATTLSVSVTSTRAGGEDVKLDLTDEEEGEEESSEVSNHRGLPESVVKTSFLFMTSHGTCPRSAPWGTEISRWLLDL